MTEENLRKTFFELIGENYGISKNDVIKYKNLLYDEIDFIVWLFEESGELNHVTLSEMQDRYEEKFMTDDEIIDRAIDNLRKAGIEVNVTEKEGK